MNPPKKYTAKLISKVKASSKVYISRFRLIDPPAMPFIAGQTIMIYIAQGVNRSMSIASSPFEENEIELWYDVSPMGPGSQWMLRIQVGDTMEFMGPLGVFTLDAESPKKKVFVATGTGSVPFYSMLRQYLPRGLATPVSLYWGLRHEEDMFRDLEFRELTTWYSNFSYHVTLSQPQESWKGLRGHVTEHVLAMPEPLTDCEYYLCGNKAMVQQMREKLLQKGVDPKAIKSELFF